MLAEYDEPAEEGYKIDETLSESGREQILVRRRERKLERQRLLQLRYPQFLISRPDGRFFQEAVEACKPDRWARIEWLVFVGGGIFGLLLYYFGGAALAFLLQWLRGLRF